MTDQTNLLDLRKDFGTKYGFRDEVNVILRTSPGLSKEVVEIISRTKGEPQWLLDFRLRALEIFMKKPMPAWGADLSVIDFNKIVYYVKPTEKQENSWDEVPENIRNTFERLGIPEAERRFLAGVGAQYESESVYHKIREDLAKQGVMFISPDQALIPEKKQELVDLGYDENHVERVQGIFRKHFSTIIPPEDNKFAALNSAVFSGGSFIYIPPGVEVNMPLQAYFRINSESFGQFERTLIIADEDSRVSYLEGCTAPVYSKDSLHSAVVEIIAMPRAKLRYTTLQNWSNNVYNLVTKRAFAYDDAYVEWIDANIGCLTGDSKIFLNNDVKEIKDIEAGDVVFALDESMDLQRHQVLAKKYSGKQKVFSLVSENHREIKATANHPFLTLTKIGKRVILRWKRLDEITEKDLVAISGDLPDYGKPMKIKYSKKTGTKNIKYPETTTEDLMWLLGFYIGDGYTDRNRTYFAVPESDKSRKKVIEIIKAIFDFEKFETRGVVIRYNSVDFVRFIKHLGFSGNAREKRIPQWVFSLPHNQKFAFINGYIDADGHIKKGHKNISITSVNLNLLKDVKTLAITCGLDARKISKWTRREKKPLGKEEKEYTHYFLYFGEKKLNQPISFSRVLSIDYCGEEDTYDIEVEGIHNFVANGFIVHNSKITMKYPSVFMVGPRAKADILSVAYAGKGQHQDAGGKVIHLAPDTTSTIVSKSISKDNGRTSYRGLVKVAKGATSVKSNVRCDALLLDEESRSDTYPYMQIEEEDTTISHEATVGKIGEEQIFYLMARGMSESEALAMIVLGFVQPFTKELPMEYAIEFNRLVQLEMAAAGAVG